MTATRTLVAPTDGRRTRRQNPRPATNPTCEARVHGTATAYKNRRCKCTEAITAYNEGRVRRRPTRTIQPAMVDETGRCVAQKHDSYLAWVGGCRCPTSCEKREQYLARFRTGRRQPWYKFRGPQQRVSRVNLLLLLTGFVDNPTYMERVVAANRLWRNGFNGRFLSMAEIGQLLGGYESSAVLGYLGRYAELAEKRTARRLADVQLKAVRVARSRVGGAG